MTNSTSIAQIRANIQRELDRQQAQRDAIKSSNDFFDIQSQPLPSF